ncbi:S1C family serine protease [Neorhodopirellula lusitana]|uniref:S1C family serine protease n=1 Tax=Neorhodopirellula lusitana TaxID=445327 RepID=UPI00384B7ED3
MKTKMVGRDVMTRLVCCFVGWASLCLFGTTAVAQPSLSKSSELAQQRVVKIYGAGGVGGLDAYQSGMLVSPVGHVATAWSSVLDVEPIVVLGDGRRFESKIVGFEPSLELAVLKLDASDLPYFEVPDQGGQDGGRNQAAQRGPQWGDPVLAVSNLFNIATGDEPASVLQGRIAARSELDARRGTFQTAYRGEVWLLDLVANNPGAAGGALVDLNGQLVGMLGKELRDRKTGVWLNYAIPADVLRGPIGDIIAGRKTVLPATDRPLLSREQSHSTETLGIGLIPDVLEMTPVYVDTIKDESAAQQANLQPDDLILLVNGARVAHQRAFRDQLRRIDRRDDVAFTIQRANDILEVTLRP